MRIVRAMRWGADGRRRSLRRARKGWKRMDRPGSTPDQTAAAPRPQLRSSMSSRADLQDDSRLQGQAALGKKRPGRWPMQPQSAAGAIAIRRPRTEAPIAQNRTARSASNGARTNVRLRFGLAAPDLFANPR